MNMMLNTHTHTHTHTHTEHTLQEHKPWVRWSLSPYLFSFPALKNNQHTEKTWDLWGKKAGLVVGGDDREHYCSQMHLALRVATVLPSFQYSFKCFSYVLFSRWQEGVHDKMSSWHQQKEFHGERPICYSRNNSTLPHHFHSTPIILKLISIKTSLRLFSDVNYLVH